MINVIFLGDDAAWDEFGPALSTEINALAVETDFQRNHNPADVDYIVMGVGLKGQTDFAPYTKAKAVLRLWAGVEDIITNDTLTIPLARMVGGGLDDGMVEYVVGHTMRHHLDLDRYITATGTDWGRENPPLATDRKVTILGLGALGQACGTALAQLGFNVHGWSRSAKSVDNITSHSGDTGLADALSQADIVILLLPLTAKTENTLDAAAIAHLADGAIIINPGRGPLIDDDALIAALDSGKLGHATLDTFRIEPLPVDHPFWAHPKITITPHIASVTRAKPAAKVIAENIRRGEAGEPFLYLVDREAGY